MKKESQQNRSRWWIWSRDAAWGILICLSLLHQKIWCKSDMKIKYLWARGLRSIQERWHLLIKLLRMEYWRKVNFSRVEIWWSAGSKNGRPVIEHSTDLFTQHTDRFVVDDDDMDSNIVHRNRPVDKIQIILAQGKNDQVRKMLDQSSKDAIQDSNNYSLTWRMFMSSLLQASVIMGKNSGNFTFHQKYKKRFHFKTDLWHIWKVDSRTIRWDLWSESN